MPLIVGLGNPGEKYQNTRHNAGFMILDSIAEQLGASWTEDRQANALVAETNLGGKKLVLAKPQTFMNNSGLAVQSLARTYKFDPCDIWVIYDEAALPFGVLRVRLEGSAGGHNGVKSVISHLGAEDFIRFRFGIGESPENMPLDRWVLSKFTKEELADLEELANRAAERIVQCLESGIESVTENLSA